MVFQVDGVPVQLLLPLDQAVKEDLGPELPLEPLEEILVALHVLKGKHQIQLPAVFPAQVAGPLGGDEYALPNGKSAVLVPDLPELAENIMGALQGEIVFAAGEGQAFFGALQAVLPQDVDYIAAEPGHPLVQPEAEDILYFLQHGRVVIVEVRLAPGKQVEVIFAPLRVELPAVLSEKAGPVVGQGPVRPAWGPVVVVRIGAGFVPALLEPVVLCGGVVDDEVHEDADAPPPGLVDQLLHVLHGAVLRVNLPIVADIVAIIRVGGAVHGAQPDGPHPQLLEVVQAADDAGDVPDAVAVGILEAAGVDLVDERVLPPLHLRRPPGRWGRGRRRTGCRAPH